MLILYKNIDLSFFHIIIDFFIVYVFWYIKWLLYLI